MLFIISKNIQSFCENKPAITPDGAYGKAVIAALEQLDQ